MSRFRSRFMNPARIDVRSTLDPTAARTTSNNMVTARVDVRPREDVTLANYEDDQIETYEGFERCWRVQLGEIEFNPIAIVDAANGGKGGVDPILAHVTWGVDGVAHSALMDWGRGNSLVVSGDFVEVEAIVPATYTGADPAITYSLTIASDMSFLPYAATNGPGYTIGANAELEFNFNAGAEVVFVSVPPGFYTAVTLLAGINAHLATFLACTVVASFNLASGLFEFTYTTAGAEVLKATAFSADQAAFASILGFLPGALPSVIFSQAGSNIITTPATSLSDDVVLIPAGTYTTTALDTLINSQLTSPSAMWFFQWVLAGSPTYGLKANMDATGGGAWYVRNTTQAPGWLARFGYTVVGRITARPDGLSLQSDENVSYVAVYALTPEAWISLGATIVIDSGEMHPEVTRTMYTGTLDAGSYTALLIPAYARAFRWHLVSTTVAATAASSIQFHQTQDFAGGPTGTTVAMTPLTDPKAAGAANFTTSESSWPSDEGITLVPEARYLWVSNRAGAGVISMRIEFVLDPV